MYESITYVYMHVRKYVCMYMEFIENILRAFQKPSEYIFQKYLNKWWECYFCKSVTKFKTWTAMLFRNDLDTENLNNKTANIQLSRTLWLEALGKVRGQEQFLIEIHTFNKDGC